jgi:zinc transporter ZupT
MQKIAHMWETPTNPLVSIIANGQLIALSKPVTTCCTFYFRGNRMKKAQTALGILLLVAGASTVAVAVTTATPEIPAGSAGSAIALVSGMLLMFRGRRK